MPSNDGKGAYRICDVGLAAWEGEEYRSNLKQLDVTVGFGADRATILLWPQEPLTTKGEATAFARRKIRELAEAVLARPGRKPG